MTFEINTLQLIVLIFLSILFVIAFIGIVDPHTAIRWRRSGRKYGGFLKTWIQFHVFRMHRKPIREDYERALRNRAAILKLKIKSSSHFYGKMLDWESDLIREILKTSGKFKQKFTGKSNHKEKIRLKKEGELEKNNYEKSKGYRAPNSSKNHRKTGSRKRPEKEEEED